MKYLLVSGAEVDDVEFFSDEIKKYEPDYIIAVDRGANHLNKIGVVADLLVGDLDSIDENLPEIYKDKILKLKVEKDDTDTAIAVDYALENGASEIRIIPGVGTRFDHSYGNIMLLKRILDKNVRGVLLNEYNEIELHDKNFKLENMKGTTISFFALDEAIELTLRGFHYPLEKYSLSRLNPLAISNKIDETNCEVIFNGKYLLSVIARDKY